MMRRTPIEIMVDRAVADAAVAWWKMHRPYGWSKKKHLKNPTINTLTSTEKKLAEAVAEWVKIGG